MENPFSTKFWSCGVIPFQFSEGGGGGDESIDTLVEKTRQHRLYQIAGPHGSGKSTLLLTLMQRYKEKGENVRYLFFNDQQRKIPSDLSFLEDQTLFIDGIEQLWFWKQFWLITRARRAIVTIHNPARRVPILYCTQPQFSTFAQIAQQLAPDMAEESVLREVYDRSGGNFRTAFFELYDFWELRNDAKTPSPPSSLRQYS